MSTNTKSIVTYAECEISSNSKYTKSNNEMFISRYILTKATPKLNFLIKIYLGCNGNAINQKYYPISNVSNIWY